MGSLGTLLLQAPILDATLQKIIMRLSELDSEWSSETVCAYIRMVALSERAQLINLFIHGGSTAPLTLSRPCAHDTSRKPNYKVWEAHSDTDRLTPAPPPKNLRQLPRGGKILMLNFGFSAQLAGAMGWRWIFAVYGIPHLSRHHDQPDMHHVPQDMPSRKPTHPYLAMSKELLFFVSRCRLGQNWSRFSLP